MANNKPVRIIIYSLLAIVSIILIVSLIVFLMNQSAASQLGSGMVEFFIIAILSAIFLLVSFCLGFLFVRALFRLLGNLAGFSGDKIPIRLVSLGLVAILFPQVTREVIVAPVRFFINFISYFIMSLNDSFSNLENRFGEIDLQHLIRLTIYTLRDVWAILSRSAIQLFNDLQIPNLIFAIALWIIFGQILSYLITRWTDQKATHPLVTSLAQKINPAIRKNILLTVIFIICAYLIMTSIIAVPWLQEVNSVFKENWGQQLEQIIGAREGFYTAHGDNYAASPLDTLSDSFLETQSSQDTLPQWKTMISRIRSDRTNLAQQRLMIIEQWKSKRDEAWNMKTKLVGSARSSLNLNVKGMGPLDQAYYYQEISGWLSENCDRLDKNLTQYQKFITYLDSEFEKWTNDILSALNKDLAKLKSVNRDDPGGMANIYFETTSVYNPANLLNPAQYDYLSDMTLPGRLSSLPEPPRPGSQWGIFGFISGWLLRANSYALILITGMLGFGLFGSLISSVVRDYTKPQSGKPLVEDLASAVIRGLSAAVVVFLSAKGGLAVFTTKEVEPNAYVLFFTCLVGAVFSEKIWAWAREKLGEKYPANQQKDKGEQKGTAEEKKNPDS